MGGLAHQTWFKGLRFVSQSTAKSRGPTKQVRATPGHSAHITAPDGYFLRLNAVWESPLGYTRDGLKARRFFDFAKPDDVGATRKATITKMPRP
jgi:hypothetical protein